MRDYIKLLRVKHYVKNLLIFIPLFFSKGIFDVYNFLQALLGVVCFSLISSAVYVLNDIRDVEKDRKHPKKKNRPIASGKVSKKKAMVLMGLCLWISVTISLLLLPIKGVFILSIYFGLNIAYSMGLKNKPIVDVVILAAGFVLRIIYGGILTGVPISKWLYLVVVTGSLYMGLGKRRNEFKQQNDTREVLKYYTEAFLDKNMYVCAALVIVFYALWTVDAVDSMLVWTAPVFMTILMKYSFDIEREADGDPVEVLLEDKQLIVLTVLYAVGIFILLYVM